MCDIKIFSYFVKHEILCNRFIKIVIKLFHCVTHPLILSLIDLIKQFVLEIKQLLGTIN